MLEAPIISICLGDAHVRVGPQHRICVLLRGLHKVCFLRTSLSAIASGTPALFSSEAFFLIFHVSSCKLGITSHVDLQEVYVQPYCGFE